MQKLFNKILVPVDFSSKSISAVEKACDIANQYQCSITLLHVVTISPFAAVAMAEGNMAVPFHMIDNQEELEFQLKKVQAKASLLLDDKLKIEYAIHKGTWDEVIMEMILQEKFDLVIIGQKEKLFGKRKMMLNPDKIAGQTNIPVITIPSNRRMTRLYSIVIPITDFLPVRKLMYGIYIASRYNTTLKLLGVETAKTKNKVQYYLDKAKEQIAANCNIKVETSLIVSENIAEAVNQFAMINSADLVIVNPGNQTKMPGYFSSLLGNVIQKYAAPPVLTVNPV